MRGAVFGLLLTNALLACWYLFIDPLQGQSSNAFPKESREVRANAAELALVSEMPGESLQYFADIATYTSADIAAPETVDSDAVGYCAEIGPFQSAARAQEFEEAFGQEVHFLLEGRQDSGAAEYRVFLPPFENREVAANVMQDLRSAFVRSGYTIDTFIIAQGELQNGIALGLFSNQRNASNVRDQMLALGYEVIVREEPRVVEQFWLVGEQFDSKEDFEVRLASLDGMAASVGVTEKLCQTIALDTQFP